MYSESWIFFECYDASVVRHFRFLAAAAACLDFKAATILARPSVEHALLLLRLGCSAIPLRIPCFGSRRHLRFGFSRDDTFTATLGSFSRRTILLRPSRLLSRCHLRFGFSRKDALATSLPWLWVTFC